MFIMLSLACVDALCVDTTIFSFRIRCFFSLCDTETKQSRDLFRSAVQQPIYSPRSLIKMIKWYLSGEEKRVRGRKRESD